MLTGKVISLSKEKGFGFVRPDEGRDDLFFHHSVVVGDFEALQIGEQIRYEADDNAEKPRACKVERLTGGTSHGSQARSAAQPEAKGRQTGFFANAELGFVTKLRRREKLGFISADDGGPELLFGAENVSGLRPFDKLAIGDSVRFVRGSETEEVGPPIATAVQYTQRRQKKSDLELPTNPLARRKKPTWRK